jgi:hypothetical protein
MEIQISRAERAQLSGSQTNVREDQDYRRGLVAVIAMDGLGQLT